MTDPTKKSQKEQILAHIEKYGSITPLEAQQFYGCMRLGALIWDIRRDGYDIVSEIVEVPTKNDGKARVAQYRMAA